MSHSRSVSSSPWITSLFSAPRCASFLWRHWGQFAIDAASVWVQMDPLLPALNRNVLCISRWEVSLAVLCSELIKVECFVFELRPALSLQFSYIFVHRAWVSSRIRREATELIWLIYSSASSMMRVSSLWFISFKFKRFRNSSSGLSFWIPSEEQQRLKCSHVVLLSRRGRYYFRCIWRQIR